MKVLQLCNKPPHPSVDGGTMAMDCITQGLLAAGCEVKVLSVATDKHPVRESQMDEDYREATHFESVYIDLVVKPLPAGMALLCGESYHVKRYISNDFAEKLKQILQAEHFDVVHVESIFLTPYVPLIRRYSQAAVVLRAHNVEHLIWRRVAESERHALRRWYLKHLSLALRAYEVEHLNDYDGVVCITANDAECFKTLGCRKPMTTVPFGVSATEQPANNASPLTMFHIGAMDWLPNREGIEWMIQRVWPLVRQEVPDARLHLAGRKMPQRWIDNPPEGITVEGEVPDAKAFMADKQINIVPLLSGSGIRVKIIEAMSMGKTVIATSLGAQGIDYTDGEHLLIADSPEDFARQIKRCWDDPALCYRIGQSAAALIAEQYDTQQLTKRLLTFYDKMLEQ